MGTQKKKGSGDKAPETKGANAKWPANATHAGAGKIGPGGSALPLGLKKELEAQFKTDLSDVRVMPNSTVPSSMGAKAYTVGTDIHFAPGAYDPASQKGKHLVAHEMAHVVQQKSGKTAGSEDDGTDAVARRIAEMVEGANSK